MTLGDLAPEVTLYYKHICKRITVEESKEPTSEDEAMMRLQDNVESLLEHLNADPEDIEGLEDTHVFPMEKTKLH